MRPWRQLLIGLLLLARTASAEVGEAPKGESPTSNEPALFSGENGDWWRAHFARMQAKGAVRAEFTERRWFAVRKQPVVLRGELRVSPEMGLSLHYREEGRTMIVDENGILLRDARGRSRRVPADSPAAGAGALLLPVLRFDFEELTRRFSVDGTREGEAWRLELVPKDAEMAKALRRIQISGVEDGVQSIGIDRGEKQRIVIEIGGVRTGDHFSEEEAGHYFRSSSR